MERTRVKICGITRLDDAMVAATAGADAIGFVFYRDSPRYIDPVMAAEIAVALPAFVTRVGLFVNAAETDISAITNSVRLDMLQFHGDEEAGFCRRFDLPWLKAVRMTEHIDLHGVCADYAEATAILLDSHVRGVPGGTGTSFDWNTIPAMLPRPVVLAGGLDASNVKEAIRTVRPFAVDVSGGVEKEKGIKDHDKIREFIHEVNSV